TQPDASLPMVRQSAALVDQARRDRVNYGDEMFFQAFNKSRPGRQGWGKLAAEWNAASFDAAAAAAPGTAEHTRLVTWLGAHYNASQHVLSNYIGIDDGLSVLSARP
ncbi:MAG: hypothetical protein EBX38_04375, partial [Actinobacteria bacterium]|nr:hypothetical protein [Actinomycetota bacterium]